MPTWKKVVVSGSAISQLNNDANYLATLGDSVVSSSAQIGTDISGSFISASTVFETRIAAQEAFSSSLDAEFLSESELIPLNTETGSVKTRLNTIEAATSSYATKLAMGIVSASAEGDAQGQVKLNGVNVDVSGIATGDSPQFTGIELGNASDTTITRAGAGQLAVEGNNLLRAEGDGIFSSSLQIGAGILSSSAQIADDVSGSIGPNAALIRSLTAAEISGSIGPNGALIRSLTAAEISGSLSAAAIVDLGANIVSSSNQVFAGSGLLSASAEGTAQGQTKFNGVDVDSKDLGTGDSPTFANLTLSGNLTVNGTTTTIDTNNLDIGDNIIQLNGNGAANGGIEVNDGPASGSLIWNGTDNRWTAGAKGSESAVLTKLGYGVVSGSTIASDNQGEVALSTNGVAASAIDLGLQTGDSPQFAGVNVGHASDTTITRTGAGQIAVEGNNLLRADVDNVMSGSAQTVENLVNQDVNLGTGDLTGVSGSFDYVGDKDTILTGSFRGDGSALTGITSVSEGAIQNLGIGIVSSSAGVANLGAGIVSGSSIASATQGEVALTTNGLAATAIDLGLQTSDSPQFNGVNVGHASDTTITRVAAGQLAVEGNNLLRADVDGVLSGSAQIAADISGSLSAAAIVDLAANIVSSSAQVTAGSGFLSGSAEGDAQGQIKLNGVNVDANALGTGDSPQFTNLTLSGNLTVNGTTTTIDTTNLDIGDNIISLNGNGAANGGLEVNDGPASGSLLWNGTDNRWTAGAKGSESAVLTALGYGVLSGSAEGDAQGQVKLNGVNVDANGVATGDSPQFAGVNVGHASDTTITRVAAGQIAVEGNNLLRAEGDGIMSSSLQIGDGILSSSAQIADEISGSGNVRFEALNTETGSLQAAITALGTESGSVKTRLNTIEAATSSYATKLGLGIVSASVLSNVNQGTVRLATNGVNTDIDLGLQAADSPTFTDLTLTGNLTVTGDRIEQQVTNLAVEDQFITINSGASAQDAGIFFEGQGASLGWDESESRFALDFTGGTAAQTTIAADAYIAAIATDIADANYQKDGNLFVSASGDAFIYVTN